MLPITIVPISGKFLFSIFIAYNTKPTTHKHISDKNIQGNGAITLRSQLGTIIYIAYSERKVSVLIYLQGAVNVNV